MAAWHEKLYARPDRALCTCGRDDLPTQPVRRLHDQEVPYHETAGVMFIDDVAPRGNGSEVTGLKSAALRESWLPLVSSRLESL
jgi:hypothetical protein